MVNTGQHYDDSLSSIFVKEFRIRVNHTLEVKEETHGRMTACILEGVEDVLLKEKPDLVMIYGDTNSTLAGALGASKLQIPIAHVESGLRSFNTRMPEEINRVLADRLATWLFCRPIVR